MIEPLLKYDFLYDSPVGCLGVRIRDQWLTGIAWLEQVEPIACDLSPAQRDIKHRIVVTLDRYFQSGSMNSTIPLRPGGTEFQKRVWQTLQEIPSGVVNTYGHIAKLLNTSSRAVGQACRRNNIPLFIPCHRVVSKQGLGGFMGGYRHVERKSWLLRHEGVL